VVSLQERNSKDIPLQEYRAIDGDVDEIDDLWLSQSRNSLQLVIISLHKIPRLTELSLSMVVCIRKLENVAGRRGRALYRVCPGARAPKILMSGKNINSLCIIPD
jgi:hypothetical protein